MIVSRGLLLELHAPIRMRRRSVNFQGSPQMKTELRIALAEWLAEGVIEPASPDHTLLSLLFPVPKKDGKLRWVHDQKTVNQRLKTRRFKYTGLPEVRSMLEKNDYCVSIDLSSAFYHVLIDPRSRHLLGFQALGRCYRFRVMCFGLSAAPYVFTRLMKPILAHLHQRGIKALAYLDDWLLCAPTAALLSAHVSYTLRLMSRLGLTVNLVKSELVPTQTIVFLGLLFNTRTWRLSLPFNKLKAIEHTARQVLRANSAGQLTARKLAALAGLLAAAAPASQAATFRRRSLQRNVRFAINREMRSTPGISLIRAWRTATLSLSRTALRDVTFLAHRKLRSLASAPITTTNSRTATLTSDASDAGWGGYIDLPPNQPAAWPPPPLETSGFWSRAESERSINWREATAVSLTLQSFQRQLLAAHVSHLLVRCDNTTTVAYLRRLGGRHRHLAQATEPVVRFCLRHHIHLTVEHLPGVSNEKADAASRQHQMLRHEWTISPSALSAMIRLSGPITTDWFASPATAHAPEFYTRFPHPKATGFSALAHSWTKPVTDVQLWVPPIPLLPQTVRKIGQDKASGWVVAPNWPSASWYGTLMALPRRALLHLGTSAMRPHHSGPHPLRDGRSPPLIAVWVRHARPRC